MLGIFSSGIWRIPHLQHFLPMTCQKLSSRQPMPGSVTAVAVWGHRPSGRRPVSLASKAGVPVVRLEDGFIRSFGLGIHGHPPLSLVVDYKGIYYDASAPSTLEQLIQDTEGNAEFASQASVAIDLIVKNDLSKYNHSATFSPENPMLDGAVLVVDQTLGDVSVEYGNAGEADFKRMLEDAVRENPDAEIWLKVHPDVLSGKKKGYFTESLSHPRITLLDHDVSPHSLFRYIKRAYVMTSQYGFEALLSGVPVSCYGQPWYAGWGLTDDRHPQALRLASRRGKASLIDLFSAAYFRYSRYIHPLTGKPGTLFDVLSGLTCQRRFHQQRKGNLWLPGLTLWKSAVVRPFLTTGDNKLFSSRVPNRIATVCIVWGVHGEQRWQKKAVRHNLSIWRMEDGFLRSGGLGSDLHPPLSLVLDKSGIYYDASRPSDLETLLQQSDLEESQRRRAISLRKQLVDSKLSKYNLGESWLLPSAATGKRVLLVPGQVEDDASIITGTRSIKTNHELLRTVRERNPDAFIIYKPHPDVLAGNRQGHVSSEDVARWANIQALNADIITCIQQSDEIHTLTSLSGFEGLLHGKKVFCYGLPFYAGWGLTVDEHKSPRRTKRLGLDELIYHSLIAYPTYIHPHYLHPIEVEDAVHYLISVPRGKINPVCSRYDWLLRLYRKLSMLYKVRFS